MVPRVPSLRGYLHDVLCLERSAVRVITDEVSTDRELGSIVKKAEMSDQPTVFFKNVRGSSLPVLMGVFAERATLNRALSLSSSEMGESFFETLRSRLHTVVTPIEIERLTYDRQLVGSAIDLVDELPISIHVPLQGGRYVSSGVLLVWDEERGRVNAGIYRHMVVGVRELTVNAAPNHDLARIIERAKREGKRLPAALVIGHHPSFYMASQFNNRDMQGFYEVAGSLAGVPFRVANSSLGFPLPVDAEIVLEGSIDPESLHDEGPFGEFTYYPASRKCPVMQVDRLLRRSDAIYLDIHPTHKEHRVLGAFPAREFELGERLRAAGLSRVDVALPDWGAALVALISTSDDYSDVSGRIHDVIIDDPMIKYVCVVDGPSACLSLEELFLQLVVGSQPAKDWDVLPHGVGTRNDPTTGANGDRIDTSKVVFNLAQGDALPARMDRMDPFSRCLAAYEGRPLSLGDI